MSDDDEQKVASLEHVCQCSIDVERDAKGVYRWGIKAYHDPGQEAEAIDRVSNADLMLRVRFGPEDETEALGKALEVPFLGNVILDKQAARD